MMNRLQRLETKDREKSIDFLVAFLLHIFKVTAIRYVLKSVHPKIYADYMQIEVSLQIRSQSGYRSEVQFVERVTKIMLLCQ